MSKIHIEIDADGAAFHDVEYGHEPEITRILRTLADDIGSGEVVPNGNPSTLLDVNGNRVGVIYVS